MAEISEMMLDGTLCEQCGCAMNGEAPAHPRKCHDCRKADNAENPIIKVKCKVCGRRVKKAGEKDHMRDAHGTCPGQASCPLCETDDEGEQQ